MNNKVTNNYNWQKYNKNNVALSRKLEKYNNIFKINYIENSYYNHTRDLFSLTLLSVKKIKVLDFGSNIAALSNLKNKIDLKNTIFYIYDPFAYDKKLTLNIIKDIKVYVYNDLSLLKKIKFDVVHFGSSLQYLINYKKSIEMISFAKQCKILITATPISFKKKYASKQKNHLNLIQYIHSFATLNIFFKKINFKLIFKSVLNINYASVLNLQKKTSFINLLYSNEK